MGDARTDTTSVAQRWAVLVVGPTRPGFPNVAAQRCISHQGTVIQGTVMIVKTKSRAEREKELQQLAKAPGGRLKIIGLYRDVLKLQLGETIPAGLPMIQVILEKEYPDS